MANSNPELQSLYSELIEHMKKGVEMHEQLADYYGFLNLPGYQKCHEYHMLCELLAYRKAKHEYMREFHQLVPPSEMFNNMSMNNMNNMANMANNNGDNNNNGNNGSNNSGNNRSNMSRMNNMSNNPIIPQNWYNYTRYEVDVGTKRTAVKEGFTKWINWEKETKEFLNDMLNKLDNSGFRTFTRKIEFLIDEVEKEIEHGEEKLLALENAGYDMSFILQQQDQLKEKYARKIRELNMKDYQHRPAGTGNYANYNFNDDDDDEDFSYAYEEYARRGGRARDARGRYI